MEEPNPGAEYVGVGPYGENEWVRVKEVREPFPHENQDKRRVVYDVLDGSNEGVTTSWPVEQFLVDYEKM